MPPSATDRKRRCVRVSLGIAGTALALWVGAAGFAALDVTRPGRRALEDYHHVILNDPARHGITIAPFTVSEGSPALLCRPHPDGRLDDRGTRLRAQLVERSIPLAAPGTENNATLVLLHGRHGRKEDNLPIAVRFCAAGFRCLLLDLPAHGANPHPVATFGPNEVLLPHKALSEAASKFDFVPRPSALWGMSMGGSVAVHAAAATPSAWDALIVVASFDSLSPVIARQCRQLLGTTLGAPFHHTLKTFFQWDTGIALDRIQPALLAPQVRTPTLIAHGDDDPLIPLPATRHLFDAIGSPDKHWVNVGSGTHGNVLVTPYPLYADMTAWYLTHLTHRP
jgi:alpha-beta hydrolase superfamily lysophospholipase